MSSHPAHLKDSKLCHELELLPGLSQLSLSLNEAGIDEIKGSLSIPVLSRKTSVSDLVCTLQGLACVYYPSGGIRLPPTGIIPSWIRGIILSKWIIRIIWGGSLVG